MAIEAEEAVGRRANLVNHGHRGGRDTKKTKRTDVAKKVRDAIEEEPKRRTVRSQLARVTLTA
jgi:hypothetical protein